MPKGSSPSSDDTLVTEVNSETGAQVVRPHVSYSLRDYKTAWRDSAMEYLIENGVKKTAAKRWLKDLDHAVNLGLLEAGS